MLLNDPRVTETARQALYQPNKGEIYMTVEERLRPVAPELRWANWIDSFQWANWYAGRGDLHPMETRGKWSSRE